MPSLSFLETSLPVQWLRLYTSIAVDTGLIPGQGSKILYALRQGQKKKSLLDLGNTESGS